MSQLCASHNSWWWQLFPCGLRSPQHLEMLGLSTCPKDAGVGESGVRHRNSQRLVGTTVLFFLAVARSLTFGQKDLC